jgi:hypothetical protein
MGTYKTKDEATLANKVARNFLAATRSSILSPEESKENAKLAKEAASNLVSEMHSRSLEPGTLAPGRWQSNEVRRLFCTSIAFVQ